MYKIKHTTFKTLAVLQSQCSWLPSKWTILPSGGSFSNALVSIYIGI